MYSFKTLRAGTGAKTFTQEVEDFCCFQPGGNRRELTYPTYANKVKHPQKNKQTNNQFLSYCTADDKGHGSAGNGHE